MENKSTSKKLHCECCDRNIDFGADLITAEKAVSGPRGIVPLGEIRLFCSEKCLSVFFNGTPADDLPEVPRRVPY